MKQVFKHKTMIKKITKFLYNEFILPIRTQWYVHRKSRALRRAKKLANFMSESKDYQKHLVMVDPDGSCQIINKDQFKQWRMKRRGRIDRNAKWSDFIRDAAHVTPPKPTGTKEGIVWISVKDRLPEMCVDVLVTTKNLVQLRDKADYFTYDVSIASFLDPDWMFQGDDIEVSFYKTIEITYWATKPDPEILPEPPKE